MGEVTRGEGLERGLDRTDPGGDAAHHEHREGHRESGADDERDTQDEDRPGHVGLGVVEHLGHLEVDLPLREEQRTPGTVRVGGDVGREGLLDAVDVAGLREGQHDRVTVGGPLVPAGHEVLPLLGAGLLEGLDLGDQPVDGRVVPVRGGEDLGAQSLVGSGGGAAHEQLAGGLRGAEVAEVALELAGEGVHLVQVARGAVEGQCGHPADRGEDDTHDDEGRADLGRDGTVPEPPGPRGARRPGGRRGPGLDRCHRAVRAACGRAG